MAPRARKSTGGGLPWKAYAATLAIGLVVGYALRSYAPLPVPGVPELSGSDTEELLAELRDLRREATGERERADVYEEKARRLEDRVSSMERELGSAEVNLADKQVRELLSSGGAARPK